MLRFFAFLLGLLFIAGGVAGYMPEYNQNGLLFGYFLVDNMHNNIHIATGIVLLLSAISKLFSKSMLLLIGLVYLAVGCVGIFNQGEIYVTHTNGPDNLFHIGIGVFMLLVAIAFSAE